MATSTQKSRTVSGISAEMRDRQARGKDPYGRRETIEFDAPGDGVRLGEPMQTESSEDKERRGEATYVLDNPSALMAHAIAHGDSISHQRLKFTAKLCGFEDKRVT
ncbi:Fc.00g018110.m01.CDS01 [Cosmosporella sp. VM-42]